MSAEVYRRAILAKAPHVIGLLDRERFSRTHGCMDRTFWAWKFTDFPASRFQEGLCVLAYLYANEPPYRGSKRLLDWIAGGFDFWARIQRPSGDFDEAYPLERSLAATAFTSFYLAEAFGFAGDDLPAETSERFRAALTRAGDWLCRNDETHGFLSNHLAAAAGALFHAWKITGEARFEERGRYFLGRILAHQSDEGWYEEYGAADPGYQTHGTFYLVRIDELLGGDAALQASLERSFAFLAHFIHPDGSLGGEYTSRNTQTWYPAGFEMCAMRSGAARWMAEEMLPSVDSLAAAGLGSIDRWNLFPLLNNYVFALRAAAREGVRAAAAPPSTEPGVHHFPAAGLLKVRRERYDLYVGLAKGGVVKLFDREAKKLAFGNCGYIGRTRGGEVLSSQYSVPDRKVDVSDDEVRVVGSFYQVSRPVMSPARFLAFRVFSLTFGRMKAAATWLKSLLVKVLIYKKRELDLRFTRRIVLHDDGIELVDHLQGDQDVAELVCADNFTTIHMGSSRYFVPNELEEFADAEFDAPVEPARLKDGLERRRRVPLSPDL